MNIPDNKPDLVYRNIDITTYLHQLNLFDYCVKAGSRWTFSAARPVHQQICRQR